MDERRGGGGWREMPSYCCVYEGCQYSKDEVVHTKKETPKLGY